MRLVLHSSVLAEGDAVAANIDRLVDRASDEVHVLEVPEADLLKDSSWYRRARSIRRKLVVKAVSGPPRATRNEKGPHLRTIHITDAQTAKLAVSLAYAPLVILVEDREADGVLLDIVVEELGWPELRKLWRIGRQVTPRAVDTVSAGGKGSIPARIDRAVADATQEQRSARLLVVVDSDRRWPGDIDSDVSRIRATCAEHGVPVHVFEKRAAENYLPDLVIETVRDLPNSRSHTERFDALLRRNSVQRNHFPIKDGLSDSERTAGTAAGLYDQSEENDLQLLKTRLFPKRPRPLLQLSRNHRAAFTPDGLRQRDGSGELDSLLEELAQEL